jgi:hypothetical protein
MRNAGLVIVLALATTTAQTPQSSGDYDIVVDLARAN